MKIERFDWSLIATFGANLGYLEELEARFKADPASVDPSFAAMLRTGVVPPAPAAAAPAVATAPSARSPVQAFAGQGELRLAVRSLVNAFRTYGHVAADLDPLKL